MFILSLGGFLPITCDGTMVGAAIKPAVPSNVSRKKPRLFCFFFMILPRVDINFHI
jgi:hypothetical protein